MPVDDENDWRRSPAPTLIDEESQIPQSNFRANSFHDFGTARLIRGAKKLLALLDVLDRPEKEYRNSEVQALFSVSRDLSNGAFQRSLEGVPDPTRDQLWDEVGIIGGRCCNTMQPLISIFEHEYSNHNNTPSFRLSLQEPPLSHENTFNELGFLTNVLVVLEQAIQLGRMKMECSSGNIPDAAFTLASSISHKASTLALELNTPSCFQDNHEQVLEDMKSALQKSLLVSRTMPTKSVNKHWQVPRNPNSLYTGRREELQAISTAFTPLISTQQRRFVVQGMPGSGKSDLVLKYAQEHVASFWGVFWLDASTRENAKASYAEIGKLGGVEPIDRAAKHWLSHLHSSYTWLLIIDNADDSELLLEDLFPPSIKGYAQGCILVTTRNPDHLDYGNAGQFRLKEMEDDDANNLLLKAAREPEPWTGNPLDLAKKICKHLHYLPLAILNAGIFIRDGLCVLAKYIDFFDTHASRMRQLRQRNSSGNTSHFQSDKYMSILGSYDMLYQSLKGAATDDPKGPYHNALQLLHIFSYMHFQNIRLDIIVHAATLPLVEAQEQKVQNVDMKKILARAGPLPQPPIRAQIQDLVVRILQSRLFSPKPILPDMLKKRNRDVLVLDGIVTFELVSAVNVLVERGLINRGEDREGFKRNQQRYHMHPLVHQWVRDRPQDSVGEGALYCQIATTVLSRAVRLHGKDGDTEKEMRRDMMPHVDCVLQYSEKIRKQLGKNREDRPEEESSIWSTFIGTSEPTELGPVRANEYGRFSRIYLECGDFKKAEDLLQKVHDYVITRLGHDHATSHAVKRGLALAIGNQTRWNEAAKLIRQVYLSSEKMLGSMHPSTIEMMNKVGESALTQGRITEALTLHERAIAGLIKLYHEQHPEVLKTTRLIGRCYFYRMEWDKSVKLHEEASRGLRKLWEEKKRDELTEEDVLFSEEDLAMGLIRLDRDNYDDALELMKLVMDRRAEILGEESAFTLIAKANYGRILSKCGRFFEAKNLMKKTLEIAERNYFKEHLGVLAGKAWYAQVLSENGELQEADYYFRQAMEKEYYKKAAADDGEHPDRIMVVWLYVKCLTQQSRYDEALELCKELEFNIPLIGGKGLGMKHKFAEMLPGIIGEIERHKALENSVRDPS